MLFWERRLAAGRTAVIDAASPLRSAVQSSTIPYAEPIPLFCETGKTVETSPTPSESTSLARELAALFALFLAFAWITYAFTRPADAPSSRLIHPMIAIGLVFVLLPFRRETISRRAVILALAILIYWLAARLSIFWVPFLSAFIIAYLIRFASSELREIHLPWGVVVHLSRRAVNVVILVGFAGTIVLFAFVIIPSVIGQVTQLFVGARVAYTKGFLYGTERLPLDEARDRISMGQNRLVLAEPVSVDGETLPPDTRLTVDALSRLERAGVAEVPIKTDPYLSTWYEQAVWIDDLVTQIEDLIGIEDFGETIAQELRRRTGKISELAGSFVGWIFNRSTQLISGTLGFIATAVFTLVVLAYLLRAYDNYLEALILLFPVESWDKVRRMAAGVDRSLHAFLRGQMVIIVVIAALSTVAYWLAGIPFALVIGILGGLLNTIPNVGPVLGGLFAAAALLVGAVAGMQPPILLFIDAEGLNGFLVRFLLIPAAIFLVQTVDNSFVSPRVMSRAVNIDPLAIMGSVLIGGSLFGVWGVVLAIPTLVVVKSAWESSGEMPTVRETTDQEQEPGESPEEFSDLSDLF